MTVKELIAVLNTLPDDTTVVYHPETADNPYIVDSIDYDEETNTITFYGVDIFEFEDKESDIPDDVDETNYDPYCGCDMYEVDEMW